jgi:predicted DNA-binding protein (MmcQ/YjbR family)
MKAHDAIRKKLKAFGLAYPEAHGKSPWPGHDDLAVRNKTFAYLSAAGEPLSVSCKLPLTSKMALTLPFTAPTAYGLGKSGWVTATFGARDSPPLDLLKDWIDESYRAQAPKKLVVTLPEDPRRPGPRKPSPRRPARSR